MSRILVIDDEIAIRRLVAAVLARDGHETLLAATAAEAIALVANNRPDLAPDLAIVDLGLPDRDGLELVAAFHADPALPVIVLSARTEVADKIAALDLGADDYLTKPFDGDELLARVRVVLRRHDIAPPGPLTHGPLMIDPADHRAAIDGRPLALTPREFALLAELVGARGRILTHAQLLDRVWGSAHREDVEYLRVAVRALRLKIEADPASPRLILNEPGIGYRLAAG